MRQGEAAEAAFDSIRAHLAPPLGLMQRIAGQSSVECRASGATVTLSDGRTALDLGSYAVTLLGHGHPEVVAAVTRQLASQATATRTLANPVTARFAHELAAAVDPERLPRVWLGLNGSDAVEAALKLARARTGRSRVLAVRGAYHGKSMGALAATWSERYRAPVAGLLPEVVHLDPGDPGAVAEACARHEPAALIFEPVQGENGVVPLASDILRRWADDAHAAGAFVLADEVQTGFRCGAVSLALAARIPVDAVILGKALGGGVMPLSAVVCTDDLYGPLRRDPFLHTTTFGGHPLSCAAGIAFLDVLRESADRAARLEAAVRGGLTDLAARHPGVLIRVRGRGLLWGLVFDRPETAGSVLLTACQEGLVLSPCLGRPEVLRLLPPLILSTGETADALGILDGACARADTAPAASRPDAGRISTTTSPQELFP
ncbi:MULTISPECIES: aspartate aminotransferase family protein [unclassified Streptomyces]|uniref:aspartate aminotransferase family protein n=1 Tax=unclassified Streptomyces TaxID=2593676 RepID=UPI0003C986B8|nr:MULTISPECIES: aspartate aminotransferase family protein [unclassified Streptomyces]AGZ94434.1 aminotransferase class-III [Streptomyces sp. NRRL B-16215]